MTQPEMNEYRIVLQNKRAELIYESRGRGALTIETTADEMDQTQGAQERDLAIGTVDRDAKLLREVLSALDRIASGTFGICLNCEFDVHRKRLAAVPWAALCIQCQEASDNTIQPWGAASESAMTEAA